MFDLGRLGTRMRAWLVGVNPIISRPTEQVPTLRLAKQGKGEQSEENLLKVGNRQSTLRFPFGQDKYPRFSFRS